MGANLITKAEYKAYKNLNTPNHDAEIDALIPKVSEFVKTYCARSFIDYVDEPKTEYFNGATPAFILKEWPVLAVDSVEYSSDYGQTYAAITEFTDWVHDEGYIVAISPNGFVRQLRGYKVIYKAGYPDGVPADLKLAVMDLLHYYRQNDGAVHSTKAPGTNSVQIEYISTTGLPAHIRRVLDMYRADYT